MPGHIILAGGSEFQAGMDRADRRAITLAGGPDAPIRIIPAAAAPDRNHERAGGNAVRWFRSLGARDVAAVGLINRRSADDPAVVAELRAARLIYMLGGFPRHLNEALLGSAAWDACREAHAAGAVLGGSSAGAMVLCEMLFDPQANTPIPGLNLVPGIVILPHHNTFGAGWASRLAPKLPDLALLGIDERTALIDDGTAGGWTVYGPGAATLYQGESVERSAERAVVHWARS
ncbi:MAG: type 1 glutamine amidotransferase-like domain-containing protein [Oscillochloris sp.]|nr:type 1 glutamine amidotransferase-like domain-containing protein [Oscillochloris sp.]